MSGGVRNLPDSCDLAQLRYNCSLDSSLRKPGSRGVTPLAFDERAAEACARFLRSKWSTRGGLQLAKGQRLSGFKTYEKTIDKHSSHKQLQHTLLISGSRIRLARKKLPGFDAMATAATEWLKQRCSADAPPKLFHVHALRQSPATLSSSSFCVHQDTEEFTFIRYSVIVKLTADVDGEAPSAMRVLGAEEDFEYGPAAGCAGCFSSWLYHQSVPPRSEREHIKLAFFFA